MCNILNMQMDNSDFAILYFCRVDEQAVKQTAFADAELKVIDFH